MTDKKNSIEGLIEAIFYEAGKRIGKPDNKKAMSDYLSEWFEVTKNGPIGYKTLIRQYERYVQKLERAEQNAPPTTDHLNAYARFLDYDNYNEYILKTTRTTASEKASVTSIETAIKEQLSIGTQNNIEHQTNVEKQIIGRQENIENQTNIGKQNINTTHISGESEGSIKRNRWILIIVIFIAFVTSITLWYLNTKEDKKLCLFWKENHFESIVCENVPKDEKELMISPDEWKDTYKSFRKIQPSSSTHFFDSNGKAKVWYQLDNGTYEFFNQPGVHPTNGRKLLPVTPSVVDTYINSLHEEKEDSLVPFSIDETLNVSELTKQTDYNNRSAEVPTEVKKGKYCFKNESNKTLKTYVQGVGQINEKIVLQPKEQACLFLPVNEYNYSTFIDGRKANAIKFGKITVSENKEGYITLFIPETNSETKQPESSSKTTTEVSESAKDCSKGDFRIKNTTRDVLHVRIGNKTDGPLGSNYYFHLTVQAQSTECFYDIPATAYNLQYHFNELGLGNPHQYSNIKVIGCEMAEKVF